GQLVAAISHGNLVVIGTESWGDVRIDLSPRVSAEEAMATGFAFADGRTVEDDALAEPSLEVVPFAPQELEKGDSIVAATGSGYGHHLVWTFSFQPPPDLAQWEVMVD